LKPGYIQIFYNFLKIGTFAFGASTNEIIINIIVFKLRWLSLANVREGITIAGLSPGPFHINLIMHLGFRLRGLRGQICALLGFVLPSFILVYSVATFVFSGNFMNFISNNPGIITGTLAGICGLLISAIIKLGKGTIDSIYSVIIIIALVAITKVFHLTFIILIIGSGSIYMILKLILRKKFKKFR
jgi:chromate transporter